ncbi:MAG: dihydrolipoyllysine-residue acetyltransferase [Betaproteobacteria bacterium]
MLEVKVPDIGDFKDVPIIEVLVKPGDTVAAEESLVTIESDKATLEVPSPSAGVVRSVAVKVGDKVSEGSLILALDPSADGKQGGGAQPATAQYAAQASSAKPATQLRSEAPAKPARTNGEMPRPAPATTHAGPEGNDGRGLGDLAGEGPTGNPPVVSSVEVRVPDIGGFENVPVIEVFIKPGDILKVDDPIATLESDKAAMEVPSPIAGVVQGVRISLGDKVSQGTVLCTLSAVAQSPAAPSAQPAAARAADASDASPRAAAAPSPADKISAAPAAAMPAAAMPAAAMPAAATPPAGAQVDDAALKRAHASPSVRLFARELGVDLSRITGTGPSNRILRDDVQAFIKQAMSAPASSQAAGGGGALNLLAWPQVDFAKYGAVESKPLSRIQKISGANLARNWVMIPHVTQFDDADITDLEALRVTLNKEHEKTGPKITMLAFLIKAAVAALQRFPDFNASLVAKPGGDELVMKKYFNIGFAADTPNGLVVPVIRNADQKGVLQIAREMGELSAKARDGKLGPAEMQGGCFSISSLGGIGGTMFTPIINAPEVAILGVSKSAHKPVWDGNAFVPRLMLPLSLSYDHRVIDGASAARFTTYLSALLGDLRRSLL